MDNIDIPIVIWFGRRGDGKWYWSIVDEKFSGRKEAKGYGTKDDMLGDLLGSIAGEVNNRLRELRP